jgi:hypothetical protein
LNISSAVAWEGRFGDADLKVEIPPSGRIHAEWKTPAGVRQKVVDSIEEFERSVLFQLMVGGEVDDQLSEEVVDAVAITLANRKPMPSPDPSARSAPRRKPKPGQQRRRGGAGGGWGRPRKRR